MRKDGEGVSKTGHALLPFTISRTTQPSGDGQTGRDEE